MKSESQKEGFPFGEECLVEPIGSINDFAHCLSKKAASCKYATSFGFSYFCRHPRWQEITSGKRKAS